MSCCCGIKSTTRPSSISGLQHHSAEVARQRGVRIFPAAGSNVLAPYRAKVRLSLESRRALYGFALENLRCDNLYPAGRRMNLPGCPIAAKQHARTNGYCILWSQQISQVAATGRLGGSRAAEHGFHGPRLPLLKAFGASRDPRSFCATALGCRLSLNP